LLFLYRAPLILIPREQSGISPSLTSFGSRERGWWRCCARRCSVA